MGIRAPFISGNGKLEKIRHTVNELNRLSRKTKAGSLNLRFGDDLRVEFGALLGSIEPAVPANDRNQQTKHAVWSQRL